jgi:membrane fusion protein, multidrug efflux system
MPPEHATPPEQIVSPEHTASGQTVPEQGAPVLSRRTRRITGAAGAMLATLIVVTGIATRETGNAKLRDWTEDQAIPTVAVAQPNAEISTAALDLPGRLEAYSRAPIYARVSGYLKSWNADIGALVKAGQVLADVEAPDLDQQLLQAQADLAGAQANVVLAEALLKRRQTLVASNIVSHEEVDQRVADLATKQGTVKADQANVDRLQVLTGYKRLVAPFDGIVTARDTDVGALINTGGGGAPLFVVSDTHKLRVYVNVPQNYVPQVRRGAKARITVPEYPGRAFEATVEASAQAVDVASGTTRMQLAVDNAKGELMPGAFTNVHLDLASEVAALHIPASALMFDQGGLRVATVGADGRVLLKSVVIARDLGKVVEIASGLAAGDRVIDSPPDGIAAGDQVRVAGDDVGAGRSTASAATRRQGRS